MEDLGLRGAVRVGPSHRYRTKRDHDLDEKGVIAANMLPDRSEGRKDWKKKQFRRKGIKKRRGKGTVEG